MTLGLTIVLATSKLDDAYLGTASLLDDLRLDRRTCYGRSTDHNFFAINQHEDFCEFDAGPGIARQLLYLQGVVFRYLVLLTACLDYRVHRALRWPRSGAWLKEWMSVELSERAILRKSGPAYNPDGPDQQGTGNAQVAAA